MLSLASIFIRLLSAKVIAECIFLLHGIIVPDACVYTNYWLPILLLLKLLRNISIPVLISVFVLIELSTMVTLLRFAIVMRQGSTFGVTVN